MLEKFNALLKVGGHRLWTVITCLLVVVIGVSRRHLPPPLPCASSSDKAEYVNGMVAEPVRRTSSADCLNSATSSSSAAAATSNCVTASLTDAGQHLQQFGFCHY